MRHDANSGVFNVAYLNEKVRFDVQAAFLERSSVDGLTRAFTHMSLTADPRALPTYLMRSLRHFHQTRTLSTSRGSERSLSSRSKIAMEL